MVCNLGAERWLLGVRDAAFSDLYSLSFFDVFNLNPPAHLHTVQAFRSNTPEKLWLDDTRNFYKMTRM